MAIIYSMTYLSIKWIEIQLEIARKRLFEVPPISDRVFTSLEVGHLFQQVQGGLSVVSHLCHSQGRL